MSNYDPKFAHLGSWGPPVDRFDSAGSARSEATHARMKIVTAQLATLRAELGRVESDSPRTAGIIANLREQIRRLLESI